MTVISVNFKMVAVCLPDGIANINIYYSASAFFIPKLSKNNNNNKQTNKNNSAEDICRREPGESGPECRVQVEFFNFLPVIPTPCSGILLVSLPGNPIRQCTSSTPYHNCLMNSYETSGKRETFSIEMKPGVLK